MIINTLNNNFWRNWQIRTQLCMIQFILTTITVILVVLPTYIYFFYLTDTYMMTSEYIFTKQFGKWTKNLMYYHTLGVEQTFFRSQQQIVKTNKLYSLIQVTKSLSIEQPNSCLNNQSLIDDYSYSVTFCYEIYAVTPTGKSLENMKSICGILTSLVLMIDQDFDLMFASAGNIHFFSVWPGSFLGNNYDPQKRIWYTNHIQEMTNQKLDSTYFSPPHIHWTWKIQMIAQTISLLHIDGSFDGVIASHVNFSMFQSLSEIENTITFSIIDNQGKMLLSNLNITETSNIYDTNLTGLSYDDYLQIVAQENNETGISNCENDIWNQFGYLCRKSHNSSDEQLINSYHFEQASLILILQSKLTSFQKQLQDMFTFISALVVQIFMGTSIGFICYILASMIISSLIIITLFHPLISIINFTSRQIFKDSLKMKHNLKKHQKLQFIKQTSNLTQMEQLQSAFNKLVHQQTISNKSSQCNLLEQFQYPEKRWNLQKRIKKIRQYCKYIVNYDKNQSYETKKQKITKLFYGINDFNFYF